VDKDIRTILLRDEPKPFVSIKPLDRSMSHSLILLAWGEKTYRHTRAEDQKKTATGLDLAVAAP
jgi:hypothetical protein